MIKEVAVKNFKCFQQDDFSFAPLTVLTGLNSTGKSTLIQLLLLLRQSVGENKLILNGYWTELGGAEDIITYYSKEEEINVKIKTDNVDELSFDFSPTTHYIKGDNITHLHKDLQSLYYISADRFGPRLLLEALLDEQPASVGKYGEYTPQFLSIHGNNPIRNADLKEKLAGNNDHKWLSQFVEEWMNHISPGTKISHEVIENVGKSYIRVGHRDSPNFRPTNVGFGISYTLPIVTQLIGSQPKDILIMENPEAHLHPAGQTKMGELISLVASTGTQIIVETHSEHVINGIRIAVKERILKSDQTEFYYLSKEKRDVEVENPILDENGKFSDWPEGFFDQNEKNMMKLI